MKHLPIKLLVNIMATPFPRSQHVMSSRVHINNYADTPSPGPPQYQSHKSQPLENQRGPIFPLISQRNTAVMCNQRYTYYALCGCELRRGPLKECSLGRLHESCRTVINTTVRTEDSCRYHIASRGTTSSFYHRHSRAFSEDRFRNIFGRMQMVPADDPMRCKRCRRCRHRPTAKKTSATTRAEEEDLAGYEAGDEAPPKPLKRTRRPPGGVACGTGRRRWFKLRPFPEDEEVDAERLAELTELAERDLDNRPRLMYGTWDGRGVRSGSDLSGSETPTINSSDSDTDETLIEG